MRTLLLAGIRKKIPVWGFSTAFVRAGALIGVGVEPRSQGAQAAEILVKLLDDPASLKEQSQSPHDFQIAEPDRCPAALGGYPRVAVELRSVRISTGVGHVEEIMSETESSQGHRSEPGDYHALAPGGGVNGDLSIRTADQSRTVAFCRCGCDGDGGVPPSCPSPLATGRSWDGWRQVSSAMTTFFSSPPTAKGTRRWVWRCAIRAPGWHTSTTPPTRPTASPASVRWSDQAHQTNLPVTGNRSHGSVGSQDRNSIRQRGRPRRRRLVHAPTVLAENEQIRLTIAATTLAAVLGGAVLYLSLGAWLRRLQRLALASVTMAEGNFNQSVTDLHDDEIGSLARSFEEMRLTLRQRDLN